MRKIRTHHIVMVLVAIALILFISVGDEEQIVMTEQSNYVICCIFEHKGEERTCSAQYDNNCAVCESVCS